MPMTQTQLADAVAEKAGLSRADAKKALAALEEVILDEIGNAEKVKIGGVVQLDVRVRPATVGAPGPQPGDRRGDHDLREAGIRRRQGAPAREGEERSAAALEGPEQVTTSSRPRPALPGAACFTLRRARSRRVIVTAAAMALAAPRIRVRDVRSSTSSVRDMTWTTATPTRAASHTESAAHTSTARASRRQRRITQSRSPTCSPGRRTRTASAPRRER